MASSMVGKYIIKKRIGEGTFAEVRLAVHADTGEKYAVKIFDRACSPNPNYEESIEREVRIMKSLDHLNIVSLKTILFRPSKVYMFMEYVPGGDLYDEIVSKKRFTESLSLSYFKQIVNAVEYFHSRGVVHSDLKPENLLTDGKGNIKVADFGLSSVREMADSESESRHILKTQCGTPKYMAPEIIVGPAEGYDGEKADAWSCGVILFLLLAGYLPFQGEDDRTVCQSILSSRVDFPHYFSPLVRDLLSMLLCKDPEKRASLTQIRKHPWLLTNNGKHTVQGTRESCTEKEARASIPGLSPIVTFFSDVGAVKSECRTWTSKNCARKEVRMELPLNQAKFGNRRILKDQNGSILDLESGIILKDSGGAGVINHFALHNDLPEDDSSQNNFHCRPNPNSAMIPYSSILKSNGPELEDIICHKGENIFSSNWENGFGPNSVYDCGLELPQSTPVREEAISVSPSPGSTAEENLEGSILSSLIQMISKPIDAALAIMKIFGFGKTEDSELGAPEVVCPDKYEFEEQDSWVVMEEGLYYPLPTSIKGTVNGQALNASEGRETVVSYGVKFLPEENKLPLCTFPFQKLMTFLGRR